MLENSLDKAQSSLLSAKSLIQVLKVILWLLQMFGLFTLGMFKILEFESRHKMLKTEYINQRSHVILLFVSSINIFLFPGHLVQHHAA